MSLRRLKFQIGDFTKVVSISIPEKCYADVYGRFNITNNESTEYKGICVYQNDLLIAGNGKGGVGGMVQNDISCSIELQKGDTLTLVALQYTGYTQAIQDGFMRVYYFPYNE